MADRRLSQNEAAALLRKRPATVSRSDPPPAPQCSACGSFLPIDAQYAPATCPGCSVELPPDPESTAGKSAAPWRRDTKWVEAFADATARHVKALLDVRDAEIAKLTQRVAKLEAKRAKPRAPKAAK